jgi:hypothetical protein
MLPSFGPEVKILVYAGAYLASLVAVWVLAYSSGVKVGRKAGEETFEKQAIAHEHGTFAVENDSLKFQWKSK